MKKIGTFVITQYEDDIVELEGDNNVKIYKRPFEMPDNVKEGDFVDILEEDKKQTIVFNRQETEKRNNYIKSIIDKLIASGKMEIL